MKPRKELVLHLSVTFVIFSWFNSRVVGCCDGRGLTSSAGASYNLDDSKARADCACSWCGWGCLDIFFPLL